MLVNGFVLLALWKLAYTLWLQPDRLLDEPLTRLVADQSAWVMNLFAEGSPYTVGTTTRPNAAEAGLTTRYGTIFEHGKSVINIADPCNGLEFLLLYIWFIVVMPGSLRRKTFFLAGGILALHISNLLRCWGLVVVQKSYPNVFDFAHHYLFKIIIYGISFVLWYWYIKPLKPGTPQAEEPTEQ